MAEAGLRSILDSVKKVIGFDPGYTAYDVDLIIHINTAFQILSQLAVGPSAGFVIEDNVPTWEDYTQDIEQMPAIKSYVFLFVRLMFDPPPTSFALEAAKELRNELGWRLNIAAESGEPGASIAGGSLRTFFAPKVVFLEYAPVVTPDASQGNVFYLTLAGDCVISAPINGKDGEHITLELTSSGFSVTWGPGWNFGGEGLPRLSSGKTDIISALFRYPYAEWHAGCTPGF